jgi:LacI family transcriptional regulator
LGSITINDVAARAGVSIKTVSRVLNREAHVQEHTRDKVLRAVQELGYKPNLAARALASSRAYVIGLTYDNPAASYVSNLQFGAMEACRENGYHILVEDLSDGKAGPQDLDGLVTTVAMDGVILTPPVCDRLDVLDHLDAKHLPYVRIAPALHLERGSRVYMDDRRAAHDMTAYLLSLGHRRIGFIKGHQDHSAAPLRHQGYLDAMAEAGVEVNPSWVQPGAFSFRSGFGAAERLLALPERPTAIFASNDDMALAVMAVANRMGLTVPRDLSVAGFDDSPIAQVIWPQLTTVRQPVSEMGAAAATILIEKSSAQRTRDVLLEFELIIRGSTGPAPAP